MIHHIDCLEFMRGMVERGEKVDAIITDPPYLYLNHKLDRSFNEREFFELASKITDKIIFFGRGDSFYRWNLLCAEFGLKFKEEIVWDKGQSSSPFTRIARVHESISIRVKKNKNINRVYLNALKHYKNNGQLEKILDDFKSIFSELVKNQVLWRYIRAGELLRKKEKTKHNITVAKERRGLHSIVKTYRKYENGVLFSSIARESREHYSMEHPTQKPINLLRKLVLLISDKGNTIFDPFMGSGSTGVASLIEGRKFIGCEIDSEYFEIAKRRIEETDKTLKQSLFYGED